ncbi:unnamed protein product, partial [Hapterophycus canaliculatus]
YRSNRVCCRLENMCVHRKRFLDAHGLYVPGLFRVPGNTETIRQIKSRFDAGEHVQFDERVSLSSVLPFFLSFL